jgi:hypothetical protein
MNFEIDPEYVTEVTVHQTYYRHAGKETLTSEELVEVIKNPVVGSSTSTEDHPGFARLRDQLEAQGYIRCERNWSNGDRVLKPFSLNGVAFESGEQFCCAAAMKFHLERAQR